jgi:hypothetical protein
VALLPGYGSLRWWKLVQVPEQCVGIAQVNTYFLLLAYVCHFPAFNNPYTLSLRILAADFLSKAVLLCYIQDRKSISSCAQSVTLLKYFSHPSFSYLLFSNLAHKTKTREGDY